MTVVQVTPTEQPVTTQANFRQMVGEVLQWNPDYNVQLAKRAVQNAYRRIIDHRQWYGMMVKGQVNVPNSYTLGLITATQNSNIITGIGMTWDASMVGYQFRIGFSTPIYTITQVVSPTQIQLDLPWGAQSYNGVSYQIFNNLVSFGPNVKRILTCVNQRQGYRMKLNIPQEVLNIYDTWRTTTGWTFLVANYAPGSDGSPLYELYPAPTFQQSFPFLAYIQPPDLKNDNDYPYVSIRSDVIVAGSIPEVLLHGGRNNNKYYDPDTAKFFMARYNEEMNKMAKNDNDLYQKDMIWEFERYPFTQFGADFWQSHDPDSGGI